MTFDLFIGKSASDNAKWNWPGALALPWHCHKMRWWNIHQKYARESDYIIGWIVVDDVKNTRSIVKMYTGVLLFVDLGLRRGDNGGEVNK